MMNASPIKFGTSGWRGLIADDFTFANVRLAVTAIAEHVTAKKKNPTILVGIRHAILLGGVFAARGCDFAEARDSNAALRDVYADARGGL